MQCIKYGDQEEFGRVLRSLSCEQVYQLVFTVDNFGYSLIHQCAYFGQREILVELVNVFKSSCAQMLNGIQNAS